MATVNEVAIKLLIDGKEFDAVIRDMDGKLDGTGKTGTRAGTSISQGFNKAKIGILAAAAALTGILIGLNKTVEAASDFTEANNKLLVIFKGMPAAARKARDELVNHYHMSYRAAAQLLGATGDVLTGLGVQQEKALELSSATVKLAADITSFSNAEGGAEAVTQALTRAMTGERESLVTYGIKITEAMVKEELRAQGLEKLTGLALMQAKAEITLAMSLEQSKNSMGDTARTANDYASVQRQVAANMENLSMTIGSILIPIWNKALTAFNELLKAMDPAVIAGVLAIALEVFMLFGKSLADLFFGIGDIIEGVFTLNWEKIKSGHVQLYDALVGNVIDFAKEAEGIYTEAGATFQSFLDGAVSAMNTQTENTKENLAFQGEAWDEYNAALLEKLQTQEEEAIARDEAAKQREIDRLNFIATANAKAYFKRLEDEKKAAKKQHELEKTLAAGKLKLHQESLSSISSIFGALFGKSKAAAYAQAIINTWLGVTKVIGQTGIASPFAIPAILASGFAAVAQISATKYALGGEISSPTLALAGEAGPEIVAPRKTFIDVANQMIRGGEIGGGSSRAVTRKMDDLIDTIENQKLTVSMDAAELAFIVEKGDTELTDLDM
jgi:hypothetical protein